MFAIVLFALVACASAAPYRNHHHRHWHHDDSSLERFMDRDLFDTGRFWREIRREMMGIETMLANLGKHFPSMVSQEGIEGNEYKVKIPLPDFTEEEIAVKARKGLLIVQAVHKVDGVAQNNYLDVRTLPDCVNEKGTWTYDNNVLIVTFPLNKSDDGEATQVPVTQAPDHSREDMDNNPTDGNQDADVGAERGDRDLLTNEVQRNTVEATTYSVDLKEDVELLPVKY